MAGDQKERQGSQTTTAASNGARTYTLEQQVLRLKERYAERQRATTRRSQS